MIQIIPEFSTPTYILKAVNDIDKVPIGTMHVIYQQEEMCIPKGWIECNGQSFSDIEDTYPELTDLLSRHMERVPNINLPRKFKANKEWDNATN